MMDLSKKRTSVESLILLLLTLIICKIIYECRFLPWVHQYLSTLTALLLIYIPFSYMWWRRLALDFIERDFKSMIRSLEIGIIFSVIIFPIFLLANNLYQELFLASLYRGWYYPEIVQFSVYQIFLIAIPEEFFFRGYIQSQLNRIFPPNFSLFGLRWGWSIPLTALIFAFSHTFITFQWWHFSIFFPGLVFGVLREKTGGLMAPIFFHTLSNVIVQGIGYMYRS